MNRATLWKEAYRPYGDRLRREDGGTNNIWYTGKPHEEEMDLTYFGARWYDPTVGRFMGIDPVGVDEANIHSFNRYAYANNNPYVYVDPDGREVVPIQMKGLTSTDPVLKTRTYYVEKKIAKDVEGFFSKATKKYQALSVNNTFRLQDSSTIQTSNTKSKGLSRHQAGFAVDLNGTGTLSTSELTDLRTIAAKHNLSPAIKPDSDKPHFSADPKKHGYKSLSDAVRINRMDYLKKIKNSAGGSNVRP